MCGPDRAGRHPVKTFQKHSALPPQSVRILVQSTAAKHCEALAPARSTGHHWEAPTMIKGLRIVASTLHCSYHKTVLVWKVCPINCHPSIPHREAFYWRRNNIFVDFWAKEIQTFLRPIVPTLLPQERLLKKFGPPKLHIFLFKGKLPL
jgi:hypothetical protein